MKSIHTLIQTTVGYRTAMLCGAAVLAIAPGARAQQSTVIDEVVITGTRLSGATSPSPITVVDFEEVKLRGVVNAEQIISALPSAAPGRGAVTNDNGAGNAQVNLRNLGVGRTLVLVDGKRVVGADSSGVPDINAIPTNLIKRVEVVTGGASAVYGSDAIAGVVNYILRDDYEGVELDVQYGAFEEGDAGTLDVNLTFGGVIGEGRGNLTAYLGYTDREPAFRRDRPWADGDLRSVGGKLVFQNNGTIPEGRLTQLGVMFNANRELVAYDGRTYNNRHNQFLTIPQERYLVGLKGNYELTPRIETYFRASYSQSQVDRLISETALASSVLVNYGNPLLSTQARNLIFGPGVFAPTATKSVLLNRRIVENGNSGEHNQYDGLQVVVGAKGDLSEHLRYDVSAQYGKTSWAETFTNDVSFRRLQQALLVNPNGTCQDPSGGCVPLDVFTAAPGAITPTQIAFINLTQHAQSENTQVVVTGSVAGDLGGLGLQSPWAESPVEFAVGAEYRKEKVAYIPDDNLATGSNVTFGAARPIVGEESLKDVFAEVSVPVFENRPGADLLELNASYRNLNYKLAGKGESYGYGLTWIPVEGVRLRASYQRAVRAPNLRELFLQALPGTDTAVDPCFRNGAAAATAAAALCLATGQPADAYNTAAFQCPSSVCTSLGGGNRDLSFEVSDTKSLGVVLRPPSIENLSVTLDYFDIDVAGAIRPFGGTTQNVLNSCYGAGAAQNPSQSAQNIYCQLIIRGTSGQIFGGGRAQSPRGYVSLQAQNTGFLRTTGLDADISYRFDLADVGLSAVPGSIDINVLATHLLSFDQKDSAVAVVRECAGTFGLICGQPNPDWRVNARVSWQPNEKISLSLRYRWMASVTQDIDKFSGAVADPVSHEIPAQSYVDLSASWAVREDVTLRAGVINLLDNEPPLISSTFNAGVGGLSNTFPGTYDLGRSLFVGVTAKF